MASEFHSHIGEQTLQAFPFRKAVPAWPPIRRLLLGVGLLLVSIPPRAHGQTPFEASQQIRSAVVAIHRGNAAAAGFLFSDSKLVATSLEAISGPGNLVVTTLGGEVRSGTIVAWDKGRDLALVELVAPVPEAPVAAAGACPATRGQPIATLGTVVPRDSAAGGHSFVGALNLGHVALRVDGTLFL